VTGWFPHSGICAPFDGGKNGANVSSPSRTGANRIDNTNQVWLQLALAIVIALAPAGARATPPLPVQPALLPPVNPACVSSAFGPRKLANKPLAGVFHNGIDLPAPVGAPVMAVAPGVVIRVQRHGVGGLEMLVQHAGFIGVYSHLGLIAPMIAEGHRTINVGQRIARVGRSGLTYGPHLYFGMIVEGHGVDPSPYLHVGACGIELPSASRSKLRPAQMLAAK
jgi:murein DD-endopeptidase MepM/ murein hydrolase activator NlpD